MRIILSILFTLFAILLNAVDQSVPLDSLSNTNIITVNDSSLVKLFPEYPGFEQARLFEMENHTFYLEIIYRKDNLLMIDKYPMDQEKLNTLRTTIRKEKKISTSILDKTNMKTSVFSNNDYNNGRLYFIWGYSLLTTGLYSWAIPYNSGLDDTQNTGFYMLFTGTSITLLITKTKDKDISLAQAELSVSYALRGVLHGILFASMNEDPDFRYVPQMITLLSLTEGAVAYKYGKSLNVGQANAIPVYHDFMMSESMGLLLMSNLRKKSTGQINSSLLISAIAGTYIGDKRAHSIDFTKGDAINLDNTWKLYGLSGLGLSFVCEANQNITGFLLTSSSLVGLYLGEKTAKDYDFQTSDAYFLQLSTYAGYFFGYGVSLLSQSDNSGKNYAKQNIILSLAGSFTGHYLYKSYIIKNHINKKNKPETFSFDTQINPFAYNSKQNIVNLSLKFK